MTTTTPDAPVTGQDIGVLHATTRALLDNLLAAAGTDFDEWVVLRTVHQHAGPVGEPAGTIGEHARPIGRAALEGTLARALGLPADALRRLLVRTEARGHLRRETEGYALTGAGADAYRRLDEAVTGVTAKVYRGIDPADLATTGRVLRAATRNAAALA